VSNGFGMIIEMLVAILLALTIAYCISLNRRLKLLKADEQSLRATISELVTATEIAERAIAGLKLTVEECEAGLGARLRSADRFTADLDRGIAAGKDLCDRLARIVVAGGGAIPKTPAAPAARRAPPAVAAKHAPAAPAALGPSVEAPGGAQAVAAAAQAFAERLRVKVHGLAA
jgi:Domain of unknown function (DUF6468)